jgi:[ribosomal protein S18]-alanine N-acetyltransferase
MNYKFSLMTQEHAENIAYRWHYRGNSNYSIYNIDSNRDDLEEFLNPDKRGNTCFVVSEVNNVIGFFRFKQLDKNKVDMRLGLRPELTGIGNGLKFIKAGMIFAIDTYNPLVITVSIETFNKAIKVFKELGFKEGNTFVREINGNSIECLNMYYIIDRKK